jgi:hypothetical protein
MTRRRPIALALAPVLALALAATCSGSSARDPRYPRRSPGCALSMHRGLPEVAAWDDIGIARVDCYLDESEIACLGRLKTEACRMGGDILYDVPVKASRPVERGMIYRARVAHTRPARNKDEAAAAADAGSGPVVPLPAPPPPIAAPPATVDAGGQ